MKKGWCLRYVKRENNVRNYISNEPVFTDINKFIEHIKYKVGLELKIYGKEFSKFFNVCKNLEDYNANYINDILYSEYIYYDNNMDIMCWIEVHNIVD
jgi:hypothetical protein